MYREEDIEKIKLNVDKISDEAMKLYKTTYEPTFEENRKVYDEILNYIRDKKRIVYGGFAQNSLITMKDKEDGFYKETDVPDVEFYSFEPLKDLIELCDILTEKGYKFVQGTEGVHGGTYKIFVNFINYCDITYISKNIYDNCPYIESKDNIRFCHPNFMLIDIYRVFTDPMTSYFRLDKSFRRYLRLYRHYPVKNDNKIIKFNPTPESTLSKLRMYIIQNSNYIVVGTYGYNYYMKKVNGELSSINFYEIITSDLDKEGPLIYKKLQKLFNNKIIVKEYTPFFEFFDTRIEFLLDDKVILRVYNNNSRCIVYNNSDKKKTKFGTTQLILLYLISNYNYYLINRNKEDANSYLNLFINLIETRNTYLEKNKLTVLDNTPFQEFKFNCIGEPVDIIRQERLEIMEKKKQGKLLKYRYDPQKGKKGTAPDYIFNNTSGNQIINKKNLIINL
jgi:hypothetical protein